MTPQADQPEAGARESDRILIFDTTLRDGEQSPGASMTLEDKVRIAEHLEDMNVDIVEAGFPIASEGDFESVQVIASKLENTRVCGLARASDADIDRAWEALRKAKRPRIHTFIATSPIHMRYKLQLNPEEVIERIERSVSLARNRCEDVQWSPEDGTRSEHDFLCRAVETAIRAGASTINIPDTVGYAVPRESSKIIHMLRERVPDIDKVVISTHCHNDLGLAVANALAAVEAGARQVECTINGLGERAGNAAMEEIVMALSVRRDTLLYWSGVRTDRIISGSRLVASVTGFPVQYNKAIVGKNAFSHEAGIHQDGVLKHAGTYEIMRPEDVGLTESSLVFGKHSGRHALAAKLKELGYEIGDNMLADLFARFKALADRKRVVYDDDIVALVENATASKGSGRISLESLRVVCGTEEPKSAEITLAVDGEEMHGQATGDGPVDAAFNAVKNIYPHGARLELYQVSAVTRGTDAQAEVAVRLEEDGHFASGHSADTDTVVSSVRAYINALNNLEIRRKKRTVANTAGLTP